MPDAVHLTGHCYCGEVRFAVELAPEDRPIFSAYCHCDSCRRSHSAPLYQVVCLDDSQFRITEGADHVNPFRKPGGNIIRAFTTCCGTRIYNLFPGWTSRPRTPVAFFPNLLDPGTMDALPDVLRPSRQNYGDECVLEVEFLEKFFSERAGQ